MESTDVIKALKIISVAYPQYYKNYDEIAVTETTMLWLDFFKEIPSYVMFQAVKNHIKNNTFPPTIHDISNEIRVIEDTAYQALNSHKREVKQLEEEKQYPEYYGETHTQMGTLLSDEELQTVNEILRTCANRQHRLNERLWQKDQKKLGGKT